MVVVPRETLIAQSVQDFIRSALTARGIPMTQVEMRDAYDQRQFDGPLTKDYVTLGFNFDTGGAPLELGSNLRRYQHQIEVFVHATSAARGSNLAYAIRDEIESTLTIPLKDVTQSTKPTIDYLLVDPVRVDRQPIPDPEPWELFVWLIVVPVIDDHDPSLT